MNQLSTFIKGPLYILSKEPSFHFRRNLYLIPEGNKILSPKEPYLIPELIIILSSKEAPFSTSLSFLIDLS